MKDSERDNFSATGIAMLARRTAYRCSNPLCRRVTVGPGDDATATVNIGVAAHITSAAPKGPRFDESLTKDQRSDMSNGIWLCQSCSVLIDRDEAFYSTSVLQSWKRLAESDASGELKGHAESPRWRIDPFNSVDLGIDEVTNPYAFYDGFGVNYRDIANGLDVPRTQYARVWKDEQGNAREAWRDETLRRAQPEHHTKPRLVLFAGHKGSGRRTLLRRMAWDLRRQGTPCIDLLDEDLSALAAKDIADVARAKPDSISHAFVTATARQIEDHGPSLLRTLRDIAYRKLPAVIFVRVDLRGKLAFERELLEMVSGMGYRVETQSVRPYLDRQEVAALLQILEQHGRLGALTEKSLPSRFAAFRRRSARSISAVLLEVTHHPDGGNFSEIVWSEFRNLPPHAQQLYVVAAICSSRAVGIPLSLIERLAAKGVFGLRSAQELLLELSGVLRVTRAGTVFARNDRTGELLAQRLNGPQHELLKQRLFAEVMRSIDLANPKEARFFDNLIGNQILRALQDVMPLAKRIAAQEFPAVIGPNAARALNSIIRILQSRGSYNDGLTIARRSIELWKHVGNQAYFLKGFCEYYLDKRDEAKRTAERLAQARDYPYHVLHAAVLLKLLRDWQSCQRVLARFADEHHKRLTEFPQFSRLQREVDLWMHVNVSAGDAAPPKPAVLLDRIEIVVADGAASDDALYEEYRKLLRLRHDFTRAYLSFFKWLNSPLPGADDAVRLHRYRWLEAECEFHLTQLRTHKKSYPKEIVSLLHANYGRARFRQEYLKTNGATTDTTCEQHFRAALDANPQNSYAHNWLGTFLKHTKKSLGQAKIEYQTALKLDSTSPVFRHNLALLLFEEPVFKRCDLELALQLAVQSREICEARDEWRMFYAYPLELSLAVVHTLENSDADEGERIYGSDLIESDV